MAVLWSWNAASALNYVLSHDTMSALQCKALFILRNLKASGRQAQHKGLPY